MQRTHAVLIGLTAAGLMLTTHALARRLTVNAEDNIYGVGQSSAPGGGNVPTAEMSVGAGNCITVTKVTGSLKCSSRRGCITLNSGGNLNDPDGTGAAPATSSNTGSGSISGITAPNAGYLVGLFTKAAGPSGPAPAALDFTSIGTNFASLSPALNQTFFIGDGHTGDNSGAVQQFTVPAGARRLWLGISDACNYNGAPGCYTDNSGTYTVAVLRQKTSCP